MFRASILERPNIFWMTEEEAAQLRDERVELVPFQVEI